MCCYLTVTADTTALTGIDYLWPSLQINHPMHLKQEIQAYLIYSLIPNALIILLISLLTKLTISIGGLDYKDL